jgi:hypothetical protein
VSRKGLVTYGTGGDVRQIGSNTGSVDDIVEGELVNQRRGLQEEREGLQEGND